MPLFGMVLVAGFKGTANHADRVVIGLLTPVRMAIHDGREI
jgi:hypothetical protein